MSTKTFPLSLLLCPRCGGKLEMFLYSFDPHYGLLRCGCGELPIVHSIPIFREFATKAEVLSFIRERRTKEALILTLGAFARHKNFQRKGPHDPRTKPGLARLHDLIDNPLMTAQQFLTAIVPPEEADLVFYRPASPAFMSGLCLSGLVKGADGTIVHFSCGAGHLERALSIRLPPENLVGVGEDFALLYVARRFMADASHFVCASPGGKLPFRNSGAKVAIVEPEAFVDGSAPEIDRIVDPDGLIMATHLSSPHDFLNRLGGRPGRGFSLESMAKQFVEKRVFDASAKDSVDGPSAAVVTRNREVFRKVDLEDVLGCRMPRLNPVYDLDDKGESYGARLRQGVPEGVESKVLRDAGALPEEIQIQKQVLKEVQDGEVSPQALDLLAKMVVVDLPQDYS
ncbi:MAG TPA: hypothetical protein VI643_08395 [Planctomycetota bacterium]|nr:hypothetical protein [Planctomycetota bacterium]